MAAVTSWVGASGEAVAIPNMSELTCAAHYLFSAVGVPFISASSLAVLGYPSVFLARVSRLVSVHLGIAGGEFMGQVSLLFRIHQIRLFGSWRSLSLCILLLFSSSRSQLYLVGLRHSFLHQRMGLFEISIPPLWKAIYFELFCR